MASGTRTIFDNWWFTLERPAFNHIVKWSDETLTVLLLLTAIVLVLLALSNRTILKAVVFGWIILP